jgi:GT2 family glycosyltransferase
MAQTELAAPARTTAVTVVIPVWNGADVIAGCLRDLYANSGDLLHSVVAVDNASPDDSVAQIEALFPQVQIVRSSFNLGFGGGINLGVQAALAGPAGVFVLLNQDCLVEPGWLDALCGGLDVDPQAAIGGCTLLNADGSINHAGAQIQMPLAYSQHLTTVPDAPVRMEYVTGAAFAIRRDAWEAVGPFDEDFYPAYYEEADYCYRARQGGWGVLYVPSARVRHLQASQAWRKDPLLHWTQQHRSRYRFAAKHLAGDELAAFLAAERAAAEGEEWFDQSMGRVLAARHTIRSLDAIAQRRCHELGAPRAEADKRRLQVHLADLAQAALRRAVAYVQADLAAREAELEAQRAELREAQRQARTRSQRLYRQLGLLHVEDTFERRDVDGEILRAAQLHVLTVLAEYEYR